MRQCPCCNQQTDAALVVLMAGCGKSTQVPQYILEAAVAAGQGSACNIICTQPRRISAVGVSTRVAQVLNNAPSARHQAILLCCHVPRQQQGMHACFTSCMAWQDLLPSLVTDSTAATVVDMPHSSMLSVRHFMQITAKQHERIPTPCVGFGLTPLLLQERGEGVGGVVGYSVRLESRTSRRTRLLFCTTGQANS